MAARTVRRAVKIGVWGVLAGAATVSWYYRPRGSWDKEYYKSQKGRASEMSPIEESLHRVATSLVVIPTVAVTNFGTRVLNSFEELDRDKFLENYHKRPKKRGLVTIANHVSILDDPFVVGTILPLSVILNPEKLRWAACSEELCFFNVFLSSFFGAGRVYPITRGGSIYQKVISDYQGRVDDGDWVHLFPEGRVWQEVGTPMRDEQGRWCSPSGRCSEPFAKLGPLKWGIAKVICNAQTPPIVQALYHLGFEKVMPQVRNNDIAGSIPRIGNKVTAKWGDPISYEDLLVDYHRKAAERATARVLAKGKAGLLTAAAVEKERRRIAVKCRRALEPIEKVQAKAAPTPATLPVAITDITNIATASTSTSTSAAATSTGVATQAASGAAVTRVESVVTSKPHLEAGDGVHDTFDDDNAPVLEECVPTSRFVLRIVPPDHQTLTREELAAEEEIRLALYSAVTDRLFHGLRLLEDQVREHRRRKGIVDDGDDALKL